MASVGGDVAEDDWDDFGVGKRNKQVADPGEALATSAGFAAEPRSKSEGGTAAGRPRPSKPPSEPSRKVQHSGLEVWQLCKIDGQWKILSVVWTIYIHS
jgi:hypothetical protein